MDRADGFSGSELVAEHASRNLHNLLAKRPEFQKGDYEAAIKASLSDEDAILLERYRNETREPAVSGSTVALCFFNLTTGELVVANLGDSHAVLAERDPKYDLPFRIVSLCRFISRVKDVSVNLLCLATPDSEPQTGHSHRKIPDRRCRRHCQQDHWDSTSGWVNLFIPQITIY